MTVETVFGDGNPDWYGLPSGVGQDAHEGDGNTGTGRYGANPYGEVPVDTSGLSRFSDVLPVTKGNA